MPRPALIPDLLGIYWRLREARGDQEWWPAESPFEVAVGAVLTQNTAWRNVERAIANLRSAGLMSAPKLAALDAAALASLIRPAGFYNVKARRLKALVDFILRKGDGDVVALGRGRTTMEVRNMLLEIPGIGRETADSIILYALDRPVFVVDAYTRRIFGRLGLFDPVLGYEEIRVFFESRLPKDVALFKDYHAQIVVHGKETCKRRPLCAECVLNDLCSMQS